MTIVENNEDFIFSLDIGTRTIIGVICTIKGEEIKIVDYEIMEHNKRNMYDGQIHDIEGVSSLVAEIVNSLEKRQKIKLEKVSVAAAGRALRVNQVFEEMTVDNNKLITDLDIETLELKAVQKAQSGIDKENSLDYYSIGYSIGGYYLDEVMMDSLKDHRGSRIGVEILATFLPKTVVEGLYTVVEKTGLTIENITLEPIAAINLAIEKDLHLLNLALVDIGAGTSDIAITRDGKIIAFAMTQTAGDEITEAILKNYLLNFETSEKVKKSLNKKETIKIKNILGIEQEYKTEEVLRIISPTIDKIVDNISREILKYNKKAPSAVFLVGGSSKMPLIREKLSKKLELPLERINIKSLASIDKVSGIKETDSPDMITPIGIAKEGRKNSYKSFLELVFLGEKIKIFNTGNVSISDLLVLTNYDPRNLMPSWGEDLIYYRDGKKRVVKGLEGSRPEILLNGKKASLKTKVDDGDIIDITESTVKSLKDVKIYDLVSNKIPIENILVNKKEVDSDYIIKNGDNIEIIKDLEEKKTEKSLLEKNDKGGTSEEISLIVNGNKINIKHSYSTFIFVNIFEYIDFDRSQAKGNLILKVNNERADFNQELKNGDILDIYWEEDLIGKKN